MQLDPSKRRACHHGGVPDGNLLLVFQRTHARQRVVSDSAGLERNCEKAGCRLCHGDAAMRVILSTREPTANQRAVARTHMHAGRREIRTAERDDRRSGFVERDRGI
jgi:hypothetical protein